MSKKKDHNEEPEYKCYACKGELIPSGCGCKTDGCVNHFSKWPKPGTFYSPPKEAIYSPPKEAKK